jgi:hypothetical protein
MRRWQTRSNNKPVLGTALRDYGMTGSSCQRILVTWLDWGLVLLHDREEAYNRQQREVLDGMDPPLEYSGCNLLKIYSEIQDRRYKLTRVKCKKRLYVRATGWYGLVLLGSSRTEQARSGLTSCGFVWTP